MSPADAPDPAPMRCTPADFDRACLVFGLLPLAERVEIIEHATTRGELAAADRFYDAVRFVLDTRYNNRLPGA